MKRILYTFAAAALVLCACEKEKQGKVVIEQEGFSDVLLTASNAETKTIMEGGVLKWKSWNEHILVFRGDNYRNYYNKDEEGTTTVFYPVDNFDGNDVFTGKPDPSAMGYYYKGTIDEAAGTIYAIYPFNPWTFSSAADFTGQYTLDGTTLKAKTFIPRGQKLVAGALNTNVNPALAVSEDPDKLSFKNLTSLIKVNVKSGSALKQITITSNSNEILAGEGQVDLTAAEPVATLTSTNKWWNNSVVLTPLSGSSVDVSSGETFYALMPATTIPSGVSIQVATADGLTTVKSVRKSVTFNRSQVKDAGSFNIISDFSTADKAVKTASEVVATLWGDNAEISVEGNNLTISRNWKPFGWKLPAEEQSLYTGVHVKFKTAPTAGDVLPVYSTPDAPTKEIQLPSAKGMTDIYYLFNGDIATFGFKVGATMTLEFDAVEFIKK